jgi:epoxyqueuosine reductase
VPLAERAIAQRAGLGFLGLNHGLIHPRLGCKMLLGELATTVQLTSDWPMDQPCLGCEKCYRACPTGALGRDGSFDAGKCISYLTIEHKGQIGPELAARIGDRLFGCDECINCCPHQLNAPVASNPDFRIHSELWEISLRDILKWTVADFDRVVGGSAIHRIGLEQLRRNAQICLHNSK